MLVIHYSTAFKALNSFVDAFNAKADKFSDRLRTGAVMTAKEIVRLYGVALLKPNNKNGIDPSNIPSLKTNNQQLATLVKCSSRTIQRHIAKLQSAGIIQAKIFHGTKSNYELRVNPDILLISSKPSVDNLNKGQNKEPERVRQTGSGSIIFSSKATKRPHSYAGNIKNNIIIAVETVNKRSSLSLNHEKAAGNIFAGDTGEIALKKAEKAGGNTFAGDTGEIEDKNFKTENSGEKKFAKKIQETGEIASGADKLGHENEVPDPAPDNSRKLFVDLLWLMARKLLYKNTDLTENQVQIAKKLIHKFYEHSTEESISKHHSAYTERISLVYKYLQRDPKRFVPLPYIYFDLNNPNGFVGTKAWHKKHRERKMEVKCELTLSRMIRKYLNNKDQAAPKRKSALQLFRECENALRNLGGSELSNRFCAAIVENEGTVQRVLV